MGQYQETFLVVIIGVCVGGGYWHLVSRGQECCKTPDKAQDSGPNVSGAQGEKPWLGP